MTKEFNKDGSFQRQINRFTTPFGDQPGELPIEKDRYRLLWSPACPWAHRSVIVRHILGLEEVISIGTASPMRPQIEEVDWEFSLDPDGVDPVLGIKYMSEVYKQADPTYEGRPTVPVIVDLTNKQAVNNDYFKLTNYLETVWAPYHKEQAPELYPEYLRKEIDELNDVIFHEVNNGVYKCGFARSQDAYEEAYDTLFARLDDLEKRLATRRFLFGDFITDSDIRLYATLIRFDVAYYNGFKTNRNLIREYEHLWGYLRDLYQTPGFGETTDFDAIKMHYHLSITIFQNNGDVKILPKGPDLMLFESLHNREKLSSQVDPFLR
ncbi:glutathione S-transferase C-terminal domain-containing protein [Alkalihalobacillus sp. MEB130]|uniref:glutathione S-transferase family protein n=1 Tax=Alkalihalobacillus sp. MEB130 TaxID=2976704 RepID=UPI0028DDAE32|nr:glutathione S-transferase C-terminal domain-containing protein [Alkalihalobacillus sp. MEB130]MDT8859662.1 glutathione S-transferase C-terminal domain-containing protein [Alkalihalobacillus sp. MEB130]